MENKPTKRAIVMGATSGIGNEITFLLIEAGWRIGIAGRRTRELKEMKDISPEQICTATIDVTQEDAPERLETLIDELGGMDLYVHCSGTGHQNYGLEPAIELDTVATNAAGFVRMTDAAFHYFLKKGKGHVAVISSIAGTKGLGAAPAYSATKRFQNTYIEALEQLACMHKADIRFTDIRPGFVDTSLLRDGKRYPMLMPLEKAGKAILRAILHKRHVAVIDWRYRILVALWKLIPRRIWRRMPVRN